MLLLFNNLLIVALLLSLFSDSKDNGVVDGDGGDVPFCVIVDAVLESELIICVFDVAVNCSFKVLTSFSASVAL
jgi:hypothetical protein